LLDFGYELGTGLLSTITDSDGNATMIDRTGNTITITAPFGQQTTE
jgi:hypothetical protein